MSIVITGTPGVGKHTITRELAKRLDLSIIDINKIAKEEGLFEKNNDVNEVDIVKLKKILEGNLSEKNVVVGHLAPYAMKKNKLKIMIVLRRSPYDLISVYKKRNYTKEKSMENIGSEILGIITHDAINKFQEKVFQVNISGKNIDKAVDKVIGIIKNNGQSEVIDWLDLVVTNNDLKKFFVD